MGKKDISFCCLPVTVPIGAPGLIIRKGGLGSPLIFAIVFFMVFYFTSTTGEKFAKEGSWSVFVGMWFSTFVLLPIGIFLIYKAMRDSQLFNKEFYYRTWERYIKRRRTFTERETVEHARKQGNPTLSPRFRSIFTLLLQILLVLFKLRE